MSPLLVETRTWEISAISQPAILSPEVTHSAWPPSFGFSKAHPFPFSILVPSNLNGGAVPELAPRLTAGPGLRDGENGGRAAMAAKTARGGLLKREFASGWASPAALSAIASASIIGFTDGVT